MYILASDWHDGNLALEPVKDVLNDFLTAVNTSLFVNDFFKRTKVADDVAENVSKLTDGGSLGDFRTEYLKALNQILDAAKKSAL
jgi:hypothetical protein